MSHKRPWLSTTGRGGAVKKHKNVRNLNLPFDYLEDVGRTGPGVSNDVAPHDPSTTELSVTTPNANVGNILSPVSIIEIADNVDDSLEDVMSYVESVTAAETEAMKQTIENRYKKILEEQQKIEKEIRKNHTAAIRTDNGLNDNDNIESIETPLVPIDNFNMSDDKGSGELNLGHCSICLERLAPGNISVTLCGHLFCTPCLTESVNCHKQCPTCRTKLTLKKIHPIFI